MKRNAFDTLLFISFILFTSLYSQAQETVWNLITPFKNIEKEDMRTSILPKRYQALELSNYAALLDILQTTSKGGVNDNQLKKVIVPFPMPNGQLEEFEIQYSPVMESGLSESYPQLQTYTGISTDDYYKKAKITLTPHGLFVMIKSKALGSVFIQPYRQSEQLYYSYYGKDVQQELDNFECTIHEEPSHLHNDMKQEFDYSRASDCQLRQYKLALACTGEYAQYYNDGNDTNGDIVSDALSNMVIMINQVNGIYEQDLGITFILVNDNDRLIFTDPDTDPYTNNDTFLMLDENSEACNNIIGEANFDIGHVFALGGGGRAFLRSACSTNKAKGTSKADGPMGDIADLKTATHEFGHQFGASHTQNNDCFRAVSSSYEPGSGSTIMGYAGLCPPQVQSFSDLYFHTKSIESIGDFVNNTGNSCATLLPSSNQAPMVEAGQNYTIPISTPFILSGEATDNDGDPLLYTWEQYDREIAPMPPEETNRFGPLFRSFLPTSEPVRYLPSLEVLAGIINDRWEVLPSVKRTLKFRLTARDINDRFGCPVQDEMRVFVDDAAGPFAVTYPMIDTLWSVGESERITWDVAGTDQAPFNCSNVDIYYSIDGGLTFPNVLAEAIPNTGSYEFIVPNETSAFIRFMIKSSENIFFTTSQGYVSIGKKEVCERFYSDDTPIDISRDSASVIISEINVDQEESISSLKVIDIKGIHTYIGDLRFSLIDPLGKETLLLSQKCGVFENFDISFEEGAERFSCPLDDGEWTAPTESLLPYLGTNTRGFWGLKIEDVFSGDGGELTSWGIEVCYTENILSAQNEVDKEMDFSLYPNPTSDLLTILFQSERKFEGSLRIFSSTGRILKEVQISEPQGIIKHSITLDNWSSGIYYATLLRNDGIQNVMKFIKY